MATILIVDTCGFSGGVAIGDWAQVKAQEKSFPAGCWRVLAERELPGRETQERLMSALAEVLDEASMRSADLDVLAVVTGPGSFTGVRIGMAAIKGLAEALGKPVVALSRLAVLAAQARTDRPVQAWIDAGRGDVFAGYYSGGVCVREMMLHRDDAMASLDAAETVVVMEDTLPEPQGGVLRLPQVGVHEALPLAIVMAQAGNFADIALLDANYLRVPDAELARQAKLLTAVT